ncbi:MAG TPA: hypothetical protein PKC40_02310 [Saprospiraceae bacterium]|nr:hypothetical protein [Saprospiraceae bacterium]
MRPNPPLRTALAFFAAYFLFYNIPFASPNKGGPGLDSLRVNFGISLRYFFNPRSATNFTFSLAASISQPIPLKKLSDESSGGAYAFPAYQASLNIYANGLGDNIFDSYRQTNVDFVSSFVFHFGFDKRENPAYPVPLRPFNSMTAPVLENPFVGSFGVGTNLVLNNQRRIQVVGVGGFNLWRRVTLWYYNDGGPFFKYFGDRYDRWWTGGGGLEIYLGDGKNEPDNFAQYFLESTIFAYYDRFTGDVQDGFLVSNYLSFPFIPAKDMSQNFLNRGQLSFGYLNRSDNWSASWNMMGRFKLDVQDAIHRGLGMAHHPSLASRKDLLGIGYFNNFYSLKIKS